MKIVIQNLEQESAVDILQHVLALAPVAIDRYLHVGAVEQASADMFDIVIRLMNSGKYN